MALRVRPDSGLTTKAQGHEEDGIRRRSSCVPLWWTVEVRG